MAVDGHEVVRRGIRSLLTQAGMNVVGLASGAAEAPRLVEAVDPDIVVVEVLLPDGDGIDTARLICQRHPHIRWVVLTRRDDEDLYRASIVAGAAAFLLKSASSAEIVTTISDVAAGASPIERAVPWPVRTPSTGGTPCTDQLTPQERRIASLVAGGLSNRQIAERLRLAEKTVRNRVSAILDKCRLRNRTELAVHVARRQVAPS